jgi:hypothetical protein
VRLKVLGDFSHLYLMNGVGIQVPPDPIVEVGEENAIALTARGFQRAQFRSRSSVKTGLDSQNDRLLNVGARLPP